MSDQPPESVERLEQLLARVEAARDELEAAPDAERAIEILRELAELAREVEGELERARREAGAADA